MIQIESAFISRAPSGIISLFINTRDRWVPYHRYNDGEYVIGCEDCDPGEDIFKLDEALLEKKEGIKYLHTHYQEKDQIVFMWIPYELLKDKTHTQIKIE